MKHKGALVVKEDGLNYNPCLARALGSVHDHGDQLRRDGDVDPRPTDEIDKPLLVVAGLCIRVNMKADVVA